MRVRPARAEEALALTQLCIRSKAHWGYDPEFMRQAAKALTVTSAMIDKSRVLVAEHRDSGLLGVVAIEPMQPEGRFDLALLFVEPSAIGKASGARCSTRWSVSPGTKGADRYRSWPIRSLRHFINGWAPSNSARHLPMQSRVASFLC